MYGYTITYTIIVGICRLPINYNLVRKYESIFLLQLDCFTILNDNTHSFNYKF